MGLKHDWLDDGSLLILMPRTALGAWSGGDTSDYDRACKVADDWLAPFEVGGRQAFLLGGDPGMALFVPLPESGLGLLRWHYADDEDELIAFALRREHLKRTESDRLFENSEATWVLFNAAWNPLKDAPPMREAKMPTGRVIADTAFVDGERNAAIFHRFRPMGAT